MATDTPLSKSEAVATENWSQAASSALSKAFDGRSSRYRPKIHSVEFLVPRPMAAGKPLFIFLPGMDGSGELLRTQVDRLVPWFDIRCVAISSTDEADWQSLARQVSQLIADEVGLPDPQTGRRRSVYLCGESFGGCLAMQVLTLSPDLFERVILVNPASSFRRLPWMQLGPLLTQSLPSMAYRYSAKGLVPFLLESYRVAPDDRAALESAMGAVPAKTAAWRMSLLSHFEVERLPLERMTHPVLLIAGGRDRLLPSLREVKGLVARFPTAQLTLLPKSRQA
ncbi:MAG: alpha/beta hydrolase [Cyanobacteria bacterium J06598_3]